MYFRLKWFVRDGELSIPIHLVTLIRIPQRHYNYIIRMLSKPSMDWFIQIHADVVVEFVCIVLAFIVELISIQERKWKKICETHINIEICASKSIATLRLVYFFCIFHFLYNETMLSITDDVDVVESNKHAYKYTVM